MNETVVPVNIRLYFRYFERVCMLRLWYLFINPEIVLCMAIKLPWFEFM